VSLFSELLGYLGPLGFMSRKDRTTDPQYEDSYSRLQATSEKELPEAATKTTKLKCAVYLGSKMGAPMYHEAVEGFVVALAKRKIDVVYGGANNGLMGLLAKSALKAGLSVTGVIPTSLANLELTYEGLTRTFVVNSMHERKTKIFEEGDMYVALPGGVGTLEEIFEMLAWSLLSFHRKPVGVLNLGGYYDPMLEMLRRAVKEGFMRPEFITYLVVGNDPEDLLQKLFSYNPNRIDKVADIKAESKL